MRKFFNWILDPYKEDQGEIFRKARILLITCLFFFFMNPVMIITMLMTQAWIPAIMFCVVFLFCGLSMVLLKAGRYKISSNLFLINTFLVMFFAIKFDAYINSYETYVFATLGLALLIVASLVGYTRWQLVGVMLANTGAILTLYFVDTLPNEGGIVTDLHVQNLATSLVMVIVGSVAGILLIALQKNLLKAEEGKRKELDRMLQITEVYTKKSLISIINDGGDPTTFVPTGSKVAILFCDIRDFTSFTETMKPIDTVRFLNSYFNRMNQIIQTHNGEIDKLMGDCIMASFSSADSAVAAARGMRLNLQAYNQERIQYGLFPIQVGIGISFGTAVIGNIGSEQKMDYTVVGDVVNAASRLESLTKPYNVNIIISENVYSALRKKGDSRMLDLVQVKGKQQPIRIYELFDHEPDWIREFKTGIQSNLDGAYQLYLNGEINEAAKVYNHLIDKAGRHQYRRKLCADPVLNFYADRCAVTERRLDAGLIDRENWQGIHVFEEK